MFLSRKTYSISIVLFLALVITGYTLFQFKDFLEGPELSLETPTSGTTLSNSLIEVRGYTEHISHITLNGRKIFVDEEGVFREKLLLSYGYNIITLTAEDRFGREARRTLEVLYK